MKEKKKMIKQSSGSLKVEPDVLREAKEYCKTNGILISFFGTEALREKLQKVKIK
jgi:hypothetical protein